MNMNIKTIWHEFKHEKVERQFLFFYDQDKWHKLHISKNETAQHGTLNLDVIKQYQEHLTGKQVIIVHNHIQNVPTPSFPDFFQYEYLFSLFSLLNITIDDYIIVSPYGYVSFKENEHLKTHISSTDTVFPYKTFSFPSFSSVEDIFTYKKDILNHLKTNNELVLSMQLNVSSHRFSGLTLLEISQALEGEIIFFSNFQDLEYELERLKHIDRVLKPIEIFVLQNEQFIPLKKNGIL